MRDELRAAVGEWVNLTLRDVHGGEALAAMKVWAAIQDHGDVFIMGEGTVASAGALVWLASHNWELDPDARLHLHRARFSPLALEFADHRKLCELASELADYDEWIFNVIKGAASMNDEEISALLDRDEPMNRQAAIAAGLLYPVLVH